MGLLHDAEFKLFHRIQVKQTYGMLLAGVYLGGPLGHASLAYISIFNL